MVCIEVQYDSLLTKTSFLNLYILEYINPLCSPDSSYDS